MRRICYLTAFVLTSVCAFGQANDSSKVFTVKLGPDFQAAQFGLNMGSFQPYVGLDMLSAGVKANVEMTMYSENPTTLKMVKSEDFGIEISGSATMWIPHAGVKYYLSSAASRPYVFADVFKAFASVDAKTDVTMTAYDEEGKKLDSSSESADLIPEDTKKLIEDLLSIWGVDFGFGVEWKVNRHFGIAGEWGMKFHFTKATQEIKGGGLLGSLLGSADTSVNGTDSQTDSKIDLSGSLKMSKVAVALNFYF